MSQAGLTVASEGSFGTWLTPPVKAHWGCGWHLSSIRQAPIGRTFGSYEGRGRGEGNQEREDEGGRRKG